MFVKLLGIFLRLVIAVELKCVEGKQDKEVKTFLDSGS